MRPKYNKELLRWNSVIPLINLGMILDNRSLDLTHPFYFFITINLISEWNIRTYPQENITIAFLQQTVVRFLKLVYCVLIYNTGLQN